MCEHLCLQKVGCMAQGWMDAATQLCQTGGWSCPGTALGLLGGLQVFAPQELRGSRHSGGPLPPLPSHQHPATSRALQVQADRICLLASGDKAQISISGRGAREIPGRNDKQRICPTGLQQCVSKVLWYFFFFLRTFTVAFL